MGSGLSSFRRRRGLVFDPSRGIHFDPSKGMLPLLGLQVVLGYGAGSDRPPVTAALLAANVLVFFRPAPIDAILPKLGYITFNPGLVLKFGDLTSFCLSPFYHGEEAHLFCNMTNLLWTGIRLETSMGSAEFASMTAALLGLSQGLTILLSQGVRLLGDDIAFFDHHAIGFSGVLFGMKAVLNSGSDKFVCLGGMDIPAKYATWAEILLIHSLMPDTSFLGHLGGALAGLLYLWLRRSFNRLVRFGKKPKRPARSQGHITGQDRVVFHTSTRTTPPGFWKCSACSNYNSLATDTCELCSTMHEERAFSQRECLTRDASNRVLTLEDIRRMSLDRFDR